MSRLRFSISMSLDGYVAGPNQSMKDPLGEGGEQLHGWVIETRGWRQTHGMEGGTTGTDDDIGAEMFRHVGATIMGRHMFGGGTGPWPEPAWNGWWGEDPPFHMPVLVLTHHARDPVEMKGGTTFHFVTDGIRAALDQATAAAGGKDILLAGGGDVICQYMKAGLIDEMDIHMVPILLGGGARLFGDTGGQQTAYEPIRVAASPTVGHFKYRRKK